MAVELMVVDFADRVEGDQRGNAEVARQLQEKLVVRTKRGQDTETGFGFVLRRWWNGRERDCVCPGSGDSKIT